MFYIFKKQFENFLKFFKILLILFLKNLGEFSKFMCDFNINFQNVLKVFVE